jgi:predicted metalloprotease with PDZ domain
MKKTDLDLLYTVKPADPGGHRFHVQLRLKRPNPLGQMFSLPAWIPGSYLVRDFARQVESIQAWCNDQAIALTKTGNHSWQCAPCEGVLTLDYTVYAWDLSVRGAHFDESHAFFNGTSLFLCPQGHEHTPCFVDLHAPPHANDWKVYTSLPEAKGHKNAARRHGFGLYCAPDYDALIDHPVEMGTPQVVQFTAHGAVHEMVFTGVIPRLDLARIAADARKICEAQIAFFEPETKRAPFLDSADRYVFMTMVTGDGYGGLEHRASTALMAARNSLPVKGRKKADESYTSFLGLVSHEYFHTWNVKRIKPAAFAPYDLSRENHTRLLWVFEGFTSYYDDLMLLRSGVIDETGYLKLLGKTASAVHRGTGRFKQSVADSSFDAWTRYYKQDENSPNALVSYYTKGALVALGLDITLRRASANAYSLDDVMRGLWERYGRMFHQGRPEGLAEHDLPELIEQLTGVDVRTFLQRYVYGCEDVLLESLLHQQGIAVRWAPAGNTPSLDVRLRSAHGETHIATAYEGGAAHRAGLSAADTLVAINGLRVSDTASVERLLAPYKAGEKIVVHVFRRDELRAFKVKLQAPPATECSLERIA